MAFNISRFKSTIDKYGGPGRSSLFEVIITKDPEPNSTMTSNDLTFFCSSINLPGITIQNQVFDSVSHKPVNFPSTMSNPAITATFMLDSDHQILTFFHNWAQRIINYSTREGVNSAIAGDTPNDTQLPYELGYKDEYSCRMTIKHYSIGSNSDKFYEVTMEKVYPFTIGDIQLSWDSNDQFLSVPITFSCDRFYYSGDRAGRQTSGLGRGYLETLGNLAGFADVVRQTLVQGRPQSIQDAVNRLNRVRNSYNRLENFFGG